MKNISNILSESVAWHREKIKSYQFVNKAFLFSFLPILDSQPSDIANEALCKFTEIFNIRIYIYMILGEHPYLLFLLCQY
jgi:hypothetical protein